MKENFSKNQQHCQSVRGAERRANYCTLFYRLSHICLVVDKRKGLDKFTGALKVFNESDRSNAQPLVRNLNETANWQVTGHCGTIHGEAVYDSTKYL